jgi:hypothetical protein
MCTNLGKILLYFIFINFEQKDRPAAMKSCLLVKELHATKELTASLATVCSGKWCSFWNASISLA